MSCNYFVSVDGDIPQSDLQWTEKYAPSCSSEILSNSKSAARLRGWLVEWKEQTDLEARRLKKQLLKQAKKQNKSKEDIKKG